MLTSLISKLERLAERTGSFAVTVFVSIFTSMISCNQTLAIILSDSLCSKLEKDKKQFKKELQTDAEVEKMIKKRFAQSRKMLDIREKYYDKFRKFLSPKQIQKVYEMDMKDTRRFHNEMNRRAGMRGHQKGHRPLMPKEVKAK
jgi:hypothetical protein